MAFKDWLEVKEYIHRYIAAGKEIRKIMEDGKYFRDALASFAADTAYVRAVKHLYDNGLTPKEIKKNLLYPVSIEKIERVIQEYEAEKNLIKENQKQKKL